MEDIEDMIKKADKMIEQERNQNKEDKRIRINLIQEIKKLIDSLPNYPFYNKYKAILAKSIIDLQYLI